MSGPVTHALLSPSSAARWIHCPPSARINAEAADEASPYAKEGTLAHAVCELKARKHFMGMGPRKYQAELAKLRKDESWQDEMDGYTDDYLEALKDIAAGFDSPPHVALEQKVDFSEYVPEGFGTADCVMIGGDTIHVVDFKYGKGVDVSADNNPQMMIYALGAYTVYAPIYDIKTVKVTIVQPRIKREPESWELYAEDLLSWAEFTLKPMAELAYSGKGVFQEGDWCRFCAIRGSCRARAEAQLELAKEDFRMPPELTDEEVSKALELGQRLKTWLSDLEEYALGACLDGRELPGWKAVEGRSVRAWTDQEQAFAAAREAGVPEEMLYERKPLSLAAVEKLMGKKKFSEALASYVTTPPGKPTLAPADDKRPAITNRPTAEDDFNIPLS
jgi:hypothetical protein